MNKLWNRRRAFALTLLGSMVLWGVIGLLIFVLV